MAYMKVEQGYILLKMLLWQPEPDCLPSAVGYVPANTVSHIQRQHSFLLHLQPGRICLRSPDSEFCQKFLSATGSCSLRRVWRFH